MLTFRQRIQESLDNEILQKALDANTERRLKGRALAFESLPLESKLGSGSPSGGSSVIGPFRPSGPSAPHTSHLTGGGDDPAVITTR